MEKNHLRRLFHVSPLVLALLVVWSQMAWSGSEKDLYPDDIRKIKERGRLIVAQFEGVQSGFFDFASHDTTLSETFYVYQGRPMTGVDIELAVDIAQTLGVRLELLRSASHFDTVCEQVALGKADVGISKLSVTLKRAQYVRFTEPYATLHMCLLVDRLYEAQTRKQGGILHQCQHEKMKVGIYGGSALEDYMKQWFPKSEAVPYDNFQEQIQALLNGEIHVVLDDEFEVIHHLKTHPELAVLLRPVVIPNRRDHVAMAVSPKSPNLLALLNMLIKTSEIPSRVKKIMELK